MNLKDKEYLIKVTEFDGLEYDSIKFTQNDTNTCRLTFKLYEEVPQATIVFEKNDGTQVIDTLKFVDGTTYSYDMPISTINVVGTHKAYIMVYGTDDDRRTLGYFKYKITAEPSIEEIATETEFPILTQLLVKVNELNNTVTVSENQRVINENIRKSNEVIRINNENVRLSEFETIKKDYDTYKNVMIDESNVANLQNQINGVNTSLDSIAIMPYDYGAKGDGVFNDTQSVIDANSVNGCVLFSKGNFRISNNVELGDVTFKNNGCVIIDSGVTLTINSITAEDSKVIFKGLGTVKIKNNKFSVGWFDGNSLNEKWDFCRKGFIKDIRKNVVIPVPSINDKACISGVYQDNAWKVTAPLQLNDNENEMIIDVRAMLVATSLCSSVIEIGKLQKPEEITFLGALTIEGGDLTNRYATEGIYIYSGARIIFHCPVKVKHCKNNCVVISDEFSACNETYFDFLEVTGFGENGCLLKGGVNGNTFSKINYLFSNGGLSGCNSLLYLNGKIRGLSIDKIVEDLATTLFYDFDNSLIYFNGDALGGSRNIHISDIYCNSSTKPVIITSQSNSENHENIQIDNLYSNFATSLINLQKVKNGIFSNVKEVVNSIIISSDCENLKFNINPETINGTCKGLLINGKYKDKFILTKDQVKVIELPNNIINGVVNILASDGGAPSIMILRQGGALVPVFKGTLVENTTGVLTGTTGTDNKVNVSYSSARLYIENRFNASITFTTLIDC